MKTLITEDKVRMEQKYQSPEVLPSFHNFFVLSNNEKAVQVPNEERRFFMLRAMRIIHGTAAQDRQWWGHAWSLVQDPLFRATFFHYLLTIDVSRIQKGRAPPTSFKQLIQAQQAPEAIKFCKELLYDTKLMQKPMADLCENDVMALRDEFDSKGRFELKHRPQSTAFSNLIGDAYEEAMLQKDFEKMSPMKEVVPTRHVVRCLIDHFKGESYVRHSSEDINSCLEKLGIRKGQLKVPAGSSTKRCFVFPSVEGLRYLLKRQHWLTPDDTLEEEV